MELPLCWSWWCLCPCLIGLLVVYGGSDDFRAMALSSLCGSRWISLTLGRHVVSIGELHFLSMTVSTRAGWPLDTAFLSPSMSLLCHSLLIYPASPSHPPVIFFQFLVRLLCLSPCVVGKGRIDLHLLGWEWCTWCPLCLLARHTKILLNWTAEREMPRLPTVNHRGQWWNILNETQSKTE